MAFNDDQTGRTTRHWPARALTALVTFMFVGSAITKIAQVPKVVEGLTRAGVPEGAILPIGMLELLLIALYAFPRTAVLGTFLLSGFLGGAVVTHIIGRESFAPPLVAGILMCAGAYLRHPEIRDLVPLRSWSNRQAEDSRRAIALSRSGTEVF